MSDAFRIQCSCGCENWVAPQQRGLFIHCTACGTRMLAVDKSAPPTTSPIAQAAILASIPKRRINRSPFEADEVLPGDDADLPIPERLDNLHRREIEARSAFIKSADVRDAAGDEKCSQCGREIRGEWDRLESASGIVCYVCSNQATEGIPERLRPADGERDVVPRRRGLADMPLAPRVRNPAWYRRIQFAQRAVAILVASLLVGLALYTLLINPDIGASGGSARAIPVVTFRDLDDLSTGFWALARVWMAVSVVLPVFIAVYAMLFFNNSFARRGVINHLGQVALWCSPILAIQFAIILVELTLGASGLTVFASLMLSTLQLLVLVGIFFEMMDDSFWQALGFAMLIQFLNAAAVPYLNLVVFRALGVL